MNTTEKKHANLFFPKTWRNTPNHYNSLHFPPTKCPQIAFSSKRPWKWNSRSWSKQQRKRQLEISEEYDFSNESKFFFGFFFPILWKWNIKNILILVHKSRLVTSYTLNWDFFYPTLLKFTLGKDNPKSEARCTLFSLRRIVSAGFNSGSKGTWWFPCWCFFCSRVDRAESGRH